MRVFLSAVKLVLVGLLMLVLAAPARADVADELQPLDGVREGACAATATAAATGPSVKATIRDAAITPEQAAAYERIYDDAKATWRRLGGGRKRELQAVLKQLETFARKRTLTTTRMPVLFFQLEQNAKWWATNAPPPPPKAGPTKPCAGGSGVGGARVVENEIVLQWYAGQGLQVMQLATAGRANALAKACLETNPQLECDPDRVRTAMDGLLLTSSIRNGARAWEAYFAFGGGAPPWVSGLWQGTAMQALARGTQVLGDPKYLEAAKEGLGIFAMNAPKGVRVKAGSGVHYLGYSFNKGLRIYNQFLQALVGLHDVATIGDDPTARRLFDEGDRRAREELAGSDTGAWSRYSANGNESDLGYHQLLRDFLRSLCDRTKAGPYCTYADRFQGYLRQKPGLKFLGGSATNIRFYVTKIGCVTLTVTKNGRRAATVTRVLGRGAQGLAWSPRGKGTYRVQVSARDLANNVGSITKTVRVR